MDMDYDDDTQDLHIHLKEGLQKLDGDKVEQVVDLDTINEWLIHIRINME